MDTNIAAGEKIAVVGTIDPATVANTEIFSDVVDMSKFHQCLGIAALGNMAAETIDFRVYSCAAGGGSSVLLKSCSQLAAHATNNDNTQLVINVRADDLMPSGQQYIKFGLVTGGATGGPAVVIALGVDARFSPASDSDLASVVQVKL